ncbi:MAG TPA: hypothetical protein VJQ79_13720 [Acidimicrobiia bacterium]|nr:hypothetical protein [Acidimicrobiia bacterium]
MRKILIGLTVATLVLTACGEPGLAETLKLADDPASVLLIVKDEGGFVPIEFIVGQGPRMVLLRDGTLIVSGPQIEIFPQPLLPNYQAIQLGEEDMLFVLEELDALGFTEIEDEINNEAANMVADASTTVTTFYNQDGAHTFSVYALGIGAQVSDGRVPILANLIEQLAQMGFSQPGAAYEWEGLEVLAGVPQAPVEPDFVNVQPWPLDVAFDEMTDIGFGWRCASYEGAEARTLLGLFAGANQVTTWDDGETEYSIKVRPLFPEQEPCRMVVSAG